MGDTEIDNRMVLAPMTRARAGESRIPNDLMAEYYLQRAEAGLIISEATKSLNTDWVGITHLESIKMICSITKKVTKAVHEKNGKIFLQLWHCG